MSNRPQWTTIVPVDANGFVYCVGRSEANVESGAVTDAREDAARQLVESHYGSTILKDYERIRGEVRNRIVDRIRSKSEGKVAGVRVKEVYWERVEVRESVESLRYYYRAYVLVGAEKSRLDSAVAQWIATSPSVVEARAIEHESARLVEEQRRVILEGLRAVRTGDNANAARHHWFAEETTRKLSKLAGRYRKLLGTPLSVLNAVDMNGLKELRNGVTRLSRSIYLGYVVKAPYNCESEAIEAMGRILASIGLRADWWNSEECRKGWTHILTMTVGEAVCVRPGMGSSCELPIDIRIRDCMGGGATSSVHIRGVETRGAAMNRKDAIEKAWTNLKGRSPTFTTALAKSLSRIIPVPFQAPGGAL